MIDVIMPCWLVNDELIALTKSAVESLGECNLIIIDNGSPLGGGYLRSVAGVYVRNKENLGYAKAVNQGLRLSKNKLKAIANNDIRVSPGWQELAEGVLNNSPRTYSCHFRMIPYDQPFNPGTTIFFEGKERWCSSSFFVIGANEPFMYDENFLNSYDDYDYWFRVRESGWKTAYTNRAEYQHKDSTTQQLIPERSENDKKNMEYFKKKHGEYPDDQFARIYPDQMKEDWKPFP